jgi:hypothetical protein
MRRRPVSTAVSGQTRPSADAAAAFGDQRLLYGRDGAQTDVPGLGDEAFVVGGLVVELFARKGPVMVEALAAGKDPDSAVRVLVRSYLDAVPA